MKKVRGILIFLATLAIFGIGVESFAKNHAIFSSVLISSQKTVFLSKGGLEKDWKGSGPEGTPTLTEAVTLIEKVEVEILKTAYLTNGGLESNWKGSGSEGAPHLFQATYLFEQSQIEKLRRIYLALGGSASDWKSRSGDEDNPTPKEAEVLVRQILNQIANWRKIFGSGDQTWSGFPWTGSGPQATHVLKLNGDRVILPWTISASQSTPTLIEAQNLHDDAVAEILRLKTEYDALGGLASEWGGSYNNPNTPSGVNTPTLSEAQTLHNELVAEITKLKTDYRTRRGSEDKWTGSFQGTPTLSEAQALVQLLQKAKSSHSPSSNNHTLIIGVSSGVGGALLLGGLGYWFYRRRKK